MTEEQRAAILTRAAHLKFHAKLKRQTDELLLGGWGFEELCTMIWVDDDGRLVDAEIIPREFKVLSGRATPKRA